MLPAIQNNYTAFQRQINMNSYSSGAAWKPHSPAFERGTHKPSEQASNMSRGYYEKTSFQMATHNSPHGSSSQYVAQTKMVKWDNAPAHGNFSSNPNGRRLASDDKCHAGSVSRNSPVTISGFTDNQGTISAGNYDIRVRKADSSVTLINKQTGVTNVINGDPHYGKITFDGSIDFQIPGGHLTVDTGPATKGAAAPYAKQATLQFNGKTYQIQGISQEDKAPLTVNQTSNARPPHGMRLVATNDSNGFINPQTGKAPTQSDFDQYKKSNHLR